MFQWGSTLKVHIEFPATSRHRRDMTERLLKATLSPTQTNKSTVSIDFVSAEVESQGKDQPVHARPKPQERFRLNCPGITIFTPEFKTI